MFCKFESCRYYFFDITILLSVLGNKQIVFLFLFFSFLFSLLRYFLDPCFECERVVEFINVEYTRLQFQIINIIDNK